VMVNGAFSTMGHGWMSTSTSSDTGGTRNV